MLGRFTVVLHFVRPAASAAVESAVVLRNVLRFVMLSSLEYFDLKIIHLSQGGL